MKLLSEQTKNELLDSLLTRNEQYITRIWAIITVDKDSIHKLEVTSPILGPASVELGAIINEYAYVGITEQSIYIAIIYTHNPSRVKQQIKIPLHTIRNVKLKKSLLSEKTGIHLTLVEGNIILSVTKNSGGSDIKNQRESVEKFMKYLENL